jgi:hypothetical protein
MTWRQLLDSAREFPWVAMAVFGVVWTLLGTRVVAPWKGFYRGEYPEAYESMSPENKERLRRVPHWMPVPDRKTPS